MAGIEAARDAGLGVKVNAVIQRGLNTEEILPLANRFKGSGITLRYIEYMDVGNCNGWKDKDVVSAEEILGVLGQVFNNFHYQNIKKVESSHRRQYMKEKH